LDSGHVRLHAEYKVTGVVAKGIVDFVILLKDFAIICVVEVSYVWYGISQAGFFSGRVEA